MEDFDISRDGVRHTSAKPGEHSKLDQVVDRIQKKSGLKASSKGEYSSDINTKPKVPTREASPMVQLNLNKCSQMFGVLVSVWKRNSESLLKRKRG